jgi:hypothetical protein
MAGVVTALPQTAGSSSPKAATDSLTLDISKAVAFDRSAPLRDLVARAPARNTRIKLPPERGSLASNQRFSGDGAVQSTTGPGSIPSPILTFEGLSNNDNQNLFGSMVSPPDPNGEAGPNNYVEMVNLVFAVYDRSGNLQLGPLTLGDLWDGFAIDDCTDLSGDPVVVYDQLADRWLLTQFTTRGPVYYNCLAVSETGDPTGTYFRYAFSTGLNFPDYPKWSVWPNAYFISTREFAADDTFVGDGAYAVERDKVLEGDPDARVVSFLLPPEVTPYLPGDGLLPSDLDGRTKPPPGSPNYFVGTMDDGASYGAPFDGINVFAYSVKWRHVPQASFILVAQLPVASFDSIFPCSPGSRNCIPQPGTANTVDILSYRQRPTFRLSYRNFRGYESLVTNQSVEALPGVAGVRWYELRRTGGVFSIYQQGTYAPDDGVHRWMGSIATNKNGNMALGFSVSNAIDVYPGIRYTGRLVGDPLGEMTLGEGVLIDGSGSQLVSARWGDYTDMTVDPVDDCTFWYVNEYYQTSSDRGWQTRIGHLTLGDC